MTAAECTLPRRPASGPQARGLGTPVTSLPGATRADGVPTAPSADPDAPPARASDASVPPATARARPKAPPARARPKAPRRRGGLLDGVAATAAFATRHAVVRPLLAAAPLAYHLLPEHVAAELVADVVACVAALASVFLESTEGAAFEAACRDAFEDAFRAAGSPEGRKLAVGGTTLAIRAFEAFASEESRALMDAGEAVALDALDLLATPEARDAVRGMRSALGALAVVLDTPRCKQAVAGAVEDICENLRTHRDGDDRGARRRSARVPSNTFAEAPSSSDESDGGTPAASPAADALRGLLARHQRRAVAARPRSLCRLVAAGCFVVTVLAFSGVGAASLSYHVLGPRVLRAYNIIVHDEL